MYGGKYYIGVSPETLFVIVTVIAFLAGILLSYFAGKLYNCCCRRRVITVGFVTAHGERIHCQRACAEKLTNGKVTQKAFCLLCTPYGVD